MAATATLCAPPLTDNFAGARGDSGVLGGANSGEENAAVTGPASPQAYLYRLRHGRFDSLTTLMSTPYAAPPLRILTDVLREVMLLKQRLASKEFTEADDTFGENDAWEALERMTRTLSDPLAIRHLFSKAINAVQEASEAASVVGDYLSERELQDKLREMDSFAEQLHQWNSVNAASIATSTTTTADAASAIVPQTSQDANCRRLLEWSLPDAVMAEMWHALLELCSLTGAFDVAVESLNQLIELSELVERIGAKGKFGETQGEKSGNDGDERGEDMGQLEDFTLDSVVEAVESEARHAFAPVTALDYIRAICSCKLSRKFDIAHTLFQRCMQHAQSGAFLLTANDITAALIGLAQCCNNTAHFSMLQELFLKSEAASVVPVSVELYTALIDAVSTASENTQRMEIALALYRRLRDGGLSPTADTYAALMHCCSSVKEPTHAFAFYHEARQQCGVDNLSSAVYTNLILSYARAGYGADARKTLEVLVEAGAPLTRGAFHAALSSAVTVREAEELLELMQRKYKISPTPQTYAYLVQAAGAHRNGVSTILQIFDWHELVLKNLLDFGGLTSSNATSQVLLIEQEEKMGRLALSTSRVAAALESDLLARYPAYAEALEGALVRLPVDPTADSRLEPYMRPLVRLSQLRMNTFTEMAPQIPTRIPKGAAIAVLAADVLANLEEWFIPFVSHYSVVVIPYSSLVALRRGGGRRKDATFAKGPQYLLNDPQWRVMGSETEVMVESRRRVLVNFLQTYRDFIHLVSLEEELTLNRDCNRYGIGAKNIFSRCAAFALNLARLDVANGTKVYAEQECNIVLVSANFDKCGRYVVDLKREFGRENNSSNTPHGLTDGLQRVWYHNPQTSPHWRPPQVSIVSLVGTAAKNDGCR